MDKIIFSILVGATVLVGIWLYNEVKHFLREDWPEVISLWKKRKQ